jgi:hypothetical protein
LQVFEKLIIGISSTIRNLGKFVIFYDIAGFLRAGFFADYLHVSIPKINSRHGCRRMLRIKNYNAELFLGGG